MLFTERYVANYTQTIPKGSSGGKLKLHVPALMKDIGAGEAEVYPPLPLSDGVFCNAKACLPSISKTITTQNFITAEVPYEPFANPILHFGSEVEVFTHDRDGLNLRIRTLDIDNSVLV